MTAVEQRGGDFFTDTREEKQIYVLTDGCNKWKVREFRLTWRLDH